LFTPVDNAADRFAGHFVDSIPVFRSLARLPQRHCIATAEI
jgi:hypothetical protein